MSNGAATDQADDQTRPASHVEALRFVHRRLQPRTYVEIGVGRGRTLAIAPPHTQVIGIDPFPDLRRSLSEHNRLFTVPSDTFFDLWDLEELFGGRKVDLAFIDGLHLFEYALRDFINVERACAPGSVVLLHDCYPIDAETAARVRTTGRWTGDVWKLILCLKKYRPDLQIDVADVPKSGLGIVQGLDPESTTLTERRRDIVREFVPMKADVLDEGKDETLNRVPGDWDTLGSVIPLAPFGRGSMVRRLRGAASTKLHR